METEAWPVVVALVLLATLLLALHIIVLRPQSKQQVRRPTKPSQPAVKKSFNRGGVAQASAVSLSGAQDPERVTYERTVVPRTLVNPCKGCGVVESRRGCRYESCAACCRATNESCCAAHRTAYRTCSVATNQAKEYQLLILDISYSQLSYCPKELSLVGCRLRTLNLSNNRLQSLPEDIGQLSGLQELFLQYNQLRKLPDSICRLKQLLELDVKNNFLVTLPDELGGLTSLICLSLTNNRLRHLPASVGRLAYLEELTIHGNQLQSLPPQLSRLTKLKSLFVGENPSLSSLPEGLGYLSSLVELDCSDCSLVSLPWSLGDCLQLDSLWLSSNRLSSLPHSIGNLTSLRELHLKNNKLAVFPDSILKLKPFRFTAGGNPLVSQESHYLTEPAQPSLLELSLRAVYQHSLSSRELPSHLQKLLKQQTPCSSCYVSTFSERSVKVSFKTVAVFYRLPLLSVYCPACTAKL